MQLVTQGWPQEFLPIQYSVPVCESTPQPTTEIMWLIWSTQHNKKWIISIIAIISGPKIMTKGSSLLVFNVPTQHKYMAISGTKGQGWRGIPTQYRKASDILTSTLAAFLFSGIRHGKTNMTGLVARESEHCFT